MTKRGKPKVDFNAPAARAILATLLTDFIDRGLDAEALRSGYEGPLPADVKDKCCKNAAFSQVDYDIAFKSLVSADLVKTGPMKLLDNDPSSGILVIGFRSENKYSYLTEEGYQEAGKLRAIKPSRPSTTSLHISGGTFHNSPIGVGHAVSQILNLNEMTADQIIERLREEVTAQIGDQSRQQDILEKLDALQAAHDKPTRIERYMQTMGAIGDHITVLSFLLTPLLHRLQQ